MKMTGPFQNVLTIPSLTLGFLGFCMLVSSFWVILMKHQTRNLYAQTQKLAMEKDALNIEWSQLVLEAGSLQSDIRVEEVAREHLGMFNPTIHNKGVIKP